MKYATGEEVMVGDIIMGNGSGSYSITRQGWMGLVVDVNESEFVAISKMPDSSDTPFTLSPEYFNFISRKDEVKKEEVKKTGKPEKEFAALDALILNQPSKDSIRAVLKQQKHAGKIFDEWGLGEVLEYGKGMTFLFYGSPGTGKTHAANCIAKAMGSKLLTIGAAEIQTSEPGGANRNIQNAYKSAKQNKQVLFLDECDSLITNRGEVGMILGGEINTLLTEIEKFEGVCILATNRIQHLDEALERRISLIAVKNSPNQITTISKTNL